MPPKEIHPRCAPHLFVPDSALIEVERASRCVHCRSAPQRLGSAFCSKRCRNAFRWQKIKAQKAQEKMQEIEQLKASVEDLL